MIRKKRSKTLESRQKKYGYIFTFPFLAGSIFFVLYPLALSLVFSFNKIIITVTGYDLQSVGADNYRYLFFIDPNFKRTLYDTAASMLKNVPVVVIFSFFTASLLNQNFKGRALARAILFLPVIVSSNIIINLSRADVVVGSMGEKASGEVAAGVNFTGIIVNYLERLNVGAGVTDLLVSSINGIGAVLAMSAIPIVVFLAGLQSISPSLYEASYVEGATPWEVFWKISLPMISPMVLVVIIYTVIDSFTSVTNGIISRVRVLCFQEINFGLGSAMAWTYMVLVFIILFSVIAIASRFVFYYDK